MKSSANFVVSAVNLDQDWDELFITYWDSWKSPLQATGQLTFADIGKGGKEETASFEQTKQEYLASARANPDQRWIKVEDLNKKTRGVPCIVGGGAWTHHRDNPFLNPVNNSQAASRLPGPGFKSGSERASLSAEFYSQLWSWRPKLMQRAHIYGNAIWVVPEYRHSEAAVAVMNHWISVVDSLDIEAYAEGTMFSTPLFLKYGFVIISHPTMVFYRDSPTPEWARLVRELQSQPVSIVWRPKGGVYHEGKTILPWQGKPRQLKL